MVIKKKININNHNDKTSYKRSEAFVIKYYFLQIYIIQEPL